MAAEGRKPAPRGRGRSPGPYDRDTSFADREVRPGAPRERSPLRDPYDRYRAPYPRERDPLRDDPYDDPYRRPLPLDDKDPYRRPPAVDDKDPYRRPPVDDKDPYRRPLPVDDPYYDRYGRDDPYSRYRRDPYADPYRDPYYRDYLPPPATDAVAPAKRTPVDCQIIILNSALRRYAESVDRRLKNLNLIVEIVVISDDRTVTQMIEEASRKSVLFVLVCNSQNEVHQSVTLNILHTTPQEHRNMPIDDAMSLVARSFETYLQSLREKSAAVATTTPATPAAPAVEGAPFVPPSADICYLLNLLADNRQLTAEELDKVITYLTERREKQFGRPAAEPPRAAALDARGETPLFAAGADQRSGSGNAIQQQELQAKILSFLNGSGNTGSVTAQPRLGSGISGGLSGVNRASLPTQQQQSSSGMSALINFDNPSVQKALDNLIQSGPNLLKNISSTQAGLTGTTKSSPLDAGDARRSTLGYGVSSQLGPSVPGRPGGLGLMPRTQGPQAGMRRPQF